MIRERKINTAYYYYRNELLFYITSFQARNLVFHLPRPFIRAIYHLIIKFNPEIIKSLFLGVYWIIKNWKKVMAKRSEVQSFRKRGDSEYLAMRRRKDRIAKKLNGYYKQMEEEIGEAPV